MGWNKQATLIKRYPIHFASWNGIQTTKRTHAFYRHTLIVSFYTLTTSSSIEKRLT
jgi:hypothetical protein